MIKGLRHVCIVVRDLDKSLSFYRDILGLKVAKIISVKGKYPESVLGVKGAQLTYAKLRSPGQPEKSPAIFELHYWKKPRRLPKPANNHISFTVKGIDYEYKRLSRLGVKFISAPKQTPYADTKVCFAYDPDKNLIEFIEDLRKF